MASLKLTDTNPNTERKKEEGEIILTTSPLNLPIVVPLAGAEDGWALENDCALLYI